MTLLDQYFKEIEKELSREKTKITAQEIGTVQEVRDGVVILTGLDDVSFGELIQFKSGVYGMVIDLIPEQTGAIVLGSFEKIEAGETVKAVGRTLSVAVTEELLGRVVDSLGEPIDGGQKITAKTFYPLEKIAPGVVYRKSVNVPLQTGMKSIDAIIPIGRGQRELIIGDRGIGKTTIAVDTILNQKGQNVICIYCSVGQKSSKVASIIQLLRANDSLAYTIVVAASASDPAPLQYLAPYAATAIGEYFMDRGKDVLIVYDDLSKHAWAYRQISLILRRPAGREAYPGDVFYLHSRLLERACRRDEKHGGGTITALPIIETLEGDMSAYIPTNVISITDGQIILDSDLFNAGIRPAVDIGLSVSRVGGTAQTKAMKQVAGSLKLDLAQYREMAAFSQFESDLDEQTKKFLNRGAKLTQILKQDQHKTYELAIQVSIIWAANHGYLDNLTNEQIAKFESRFIEDLKSRGRKLLDRLNKNKIINKEDEEELKKYAEDNSNLV